MQLNMSVVEKGRKRPEWDLNSDLAGNLSSKSFQSLVKSTLISTAKEAVADSVRNGFDPKYTTFVDNRANTPLEAVNPFGKIEFVARANLNDIILYAYEGILQRSKELTKRYIKSHIVTVNGTEVARSLPQLQQYLKTAPPFQSRDKIRIVNIQPYARKLERYGITKGGSSQREYGKNSNGERSGGKGIKSERVGMLVPNGAYVLASRATERKYGKNAFISFSFVDGGDIPAIKDNVYKTDSKTKRFRAGNKINSRKGKPYFYPSILIKVIGSAVL